MLIKTYEEQFYRSFLRNLSVFVIFLFAFLLFSSFSYAQNHTLNTISPGVAELTIDPMHQPEVGAAADQDDNPAGNPVDGSIDVGGAAVIYLLTPAPKGTRLTGFESGDPSNPASGDVFCNGVNWVGDGSTYTGTCTERVASSNSNQCGYNESLPRPAFGLSISADATCGAYDNPCVVQAGQNVMEVADPRYEPLCNSSTVDATGQPISVNCMSTKEFNEQYSGMDRKQIPPDAKALPLNTLEIAYGGHDYLIYNGCDSRYYRVHLYDPVMAGMTNSSETFVIPTRCDRYNDYEQSMTAHSSGLQGLEVDQACPPGIIDFCPPSNTAELFADPPPATPRSLHPLDNCNILNDDGGGGCNPENPASTNMSGINMVPPDPVCDYGGNNYPLFSEYQVGTGETAQGCNCECNGSLPPWNSSAALGNCTDLCGPATGGTFSTAGDVGAAGYCGPDAQLVMGSDLSGANGTLSWECEYVDPDTGNPVSSISTSCTANINDPDPSCSVSYVSGSVRASNRTPGEQCTTDTSNNISNYTITSTQSGYGTNNFTNTSCNFNHDGVVTQREWTFDERYCEVDVDDWACSGGGAPSYNCGPVIPLAGWDGWCASDGSSACSNINFQDQCPSPYPLCQVQNVTILTNTCAVCQAEGQICYLEPSYSFSISNNNSQDYRESRDTSITGGTGGDGNCPAAEAGTESNLASGGSCTSTESGNYINSTSQAYQCSRQYDNYRCDCPAVCGSANGGYFNDLTSITPATQCADGNSSSLSVTGTNITWTCETASQTTNCNATLVTTPPPVGACGSPSGTYTSFGSIPGACAVGSATNIESGSFADTSTLWRYRCDAAGGNSGVCTANRASVINGVCGSPSGSYANFSAIPTASRCSQGTADDGAASDTPDTIRWVCNGQNGGSPSGTCTANKSSSCEWNRISFSNDNGNILAQSDCDMSVECSGAYGTITGVPCDVTHCPSSPSIGDECYVIDGLSWGLAYGVDECLEEYDIFEYNCGGTSPASGQCGSASGGGPYANFTAIPVNSRCNEGTANDGAVSDTLSSIRWICEAAGGDSSICGASRLLATAGCNFTDPRSGGTNTLAIGEVFQYALGSSSCPIYTCPCSASDGDSASISNSPPIGPCPSSDSTSSLSCPPVTASCGTPSGDYAGFASIPSGDLCNTGVPSDIAVADTDTEIRWICSADIDSGTCTANRIYDGQCASFGGEYTSQPANSGNGCAEGTYADLSDSPTQWIWRCNGENGGANPTCTANKDLPACGGNDGDSFTSLASGSSGNCADGSVGSFTDNGVGNTFTWTCNKSGESTSCSANHIENGSCRAYGGQYTSQPGTNTSSGCTGGTYSNVSNTGSNWQWQCVGIGPTATTADCSAAKDQPGCGGNVGGNFTALGSGNSGNCEAGNTVVSFTDNGVGSTFTWRCQQSGETTGLCTANHVGRSCSSATFGSGSTACSVGALSHNSSGGNCAEDGSCSYECDDGTLNEISNSCTPAGCGACPSGYTQVGDDCERVESTSRGAMISCFVENRSRVNIDCGAGPCNDVCTSVDIGITGTFRTIETVRTLECQSGSYVDIGTGTRYGANQTANASYERLEGGYAASYSIEDPDFSSFQSECDALPSSGRTCEWEWNDESPTSPSCYWVSYGFDSDSGTTCIIDIYDHIDDPTIY